MTLMNVVAEGESLVKVGVSDRTTLKDMEILFDGIDLGKVSTSMTIKRSSVCFVGNVYRSS